MMQVWKRFWRRVNLGRLALCAVLAGSTAALSACYGVAVPVAPEPDLHVVGFEYTPASPIHLGDRLVFQATTNRPSQLAQVAAHVYPPASAAREIELRDDGAAPDTTARDGVWTGEQEWPAAWGTVEAAQVDAVLTWTNGAFGDSLDGPPLTVLPLED